VRELSATLAELIAVSAMSTWPIWPSWMSDPVSELSVATYADRFDSYSGESFKTQSERKLDNGDVMVQSVLAERGGGTTRFDYILRNREGRWGIVNIVAEGVSDLAIWAVSVAAVVLPLGVSRIAEEVMVAPARRRARAARARLAEAQRRADYAEARMKEWML